MKAENILNATDIAWRPRARMLMEKRETFVVIEWDHKFEFQDATALAQEFDYYFQHDPLTTRATFEPRATLQ